MTIRSSPIVNLNTAKNLVGIRRSTAFQNAYHYPDMHPFMFALGAVAWYTV